MYYIGKSLYRQNVLYSFKGGIDTVRLLSTVLVDITGPYSTRLDMLLVIYELEKRGYTYAGAIKPGMIRKIRGTGTKKYKSNPGKSYHIKMSKHYLSRSNKYDAGSCNREVMLALAREHFKSASMM